MMTLLEFYNAIINVTRETGQGVPLFIAQRANLVDELDEMVNNGFLKKINTNGHEHNMFTFYCLPGIYCAEESEVNGYPNVLYFVRKYLNKLDENDFPFTHIEGGYNRWFSEIKDKYDKWLIDNKVGLDALSNLENVTELPNKNK